MGLFDKLINKGARALGDAVADKIVDTLKGDNEVGDAFRSMKSTVTEFAETTMNDIQQNMQQNTQSDTEPRTSAREKTFEEKTDMSANTIYAGYFADNNTLVFSNRESDMSTATEKYGEISNREDIPWDKAKLNIITVEFKTPIRPQNTANWFRQCPTLENVVNIENLDTSNVTNMNSMFAFCPRLEELDLSSFNTSNVTNMENMFFGGVKLQSINVSGFITCNVSNMRHMFTFCNQVTELDLSSFDTSNVTDMYGMFMGCEKLTFVNYGANFANRSLIKSEGMFANCPANKPAWYRE